jgi:hypothetical protein
MYEIRTRRENASRAHGSLIEYVAFNACCLPNNSEKKRMDIPSLYRFVDALTPDSSISCPIYPMSIPYVPKIDVVVYMAHDC